MAETPKDEEQQELLHGTSPPAEEHAPQERASYPPSLDALIGGEHAPPPRPPSLDTLMREERASIPSFPPPSNPVEAGAFGGFPSMDPGYGGHAPPGGSVHDAQLLQAAYAPLPMAPSRLERVLLAVRGYFLDLDPSFLAALAPLALLAILLFTRAPDTNYIFDEQEALLANPYVNATGDLRYVDAIRRDFWGLPPDRTVGSYRPLPNFVWRAMWSLSKSPFLHHFYNVLLHAVNGALLTCVAFQWTRRRGLAYLAGALFVSCAVLTEAVSGIVGIADVLGGLGALLALLALALPGWAMPFGVFLAVLFGLFSKESALVCVPLIPLAALATAPLTHPTRPARWVRAGLSFLGAGAAFVLYVELRRRWFPSLTPSELSEALPEGASLAQRAMRATLLWFHQAPLPKDPLNNPLAATDTAHRIAGALRVYWRGFVQVLFPHALSGDYSFPQEPAPDRLVFPGSVAGGLLAVLPPVAALVLWIRAMLRERAARKAVIEGLPAGAEVPVEGWGKWRLVRVTAGVTLVMIAVALGAIEAVLARSSGKGLFPSLPLVLRWLPFVAPLSLGVGLLVESTARRPSPDQGGVPRPLGYAGAATVAVGLVWIVVSFFPHSNIPVVLPTVRAERFWYFPVIGTSLVLAVLWSWFDQAVAGPFARGAGWPGWPFAPLSLRRGWVVPGLLALFLGLQCVQAYRHAMDYRSDLAFWDATRKAVPNSAKAHLNYSVMKGARSDLPARLESSKKALELAPKWPMAHVYTGDTLCRMGKAEEAWPYYKEGFELGPNEVNLIALALQCLHDQKQLAAHEEELREMAEKFPGTWIAYLGPDTLEGAEKNNGVDPKYRPRGYNEGPKE
ncbi:tetratricopeptide repeat protein [Chondromyces crocatus]|uniref:Uncharacterized protein n=1 Tax=Chondromyces crocatus TaxID=52 RepID=A0A0K1EBH0_CHOCO|nr:tetratricopeptide repeat protein [Chondromyces crocatus]AKT37928.1 uncharacterized protein CMC5_020710 [Chondromyces crocatus]